MSMSSSESARYILYSGKIKIRWALNLAISARTPCFEILSLTAIALLISCAHVNCDIPHT